jgi:hypothetical protein
MVILINCGKMFRVDFFVTWSRKNLSALSSSLFFTHYAHPYWIQLEWDGLTSLVYDPSKLLPVHRNPSDWQIFQD